MVFLVVCWVVTIICAVLGFLTVATGIAEAKGAPQQAAAAAMGVAWAVIPYCFTRAVSAIQREVRDRQRTRRCPMCAELIRGEARVCRFCRQELTSDAAPVLSE